MSLNRSEKEAVINEVTSLAAKAQTLVIAEYRGIAVADMTKLRADARSKGVSLSVLKNTLARRAVSGGQFEVVADQMTGPLIYGFSEDAVAAAKLADLAFQRALLLARLGFGLLLAAFPFSTWMPALAAGPPALTCATRIPEDRDRSYWLCRSGVKVTVLTPMYAWVAFPVLMISSATCVTTTEGMANPMLTAPEAGDS